jgi:outer membrane murein-binding lipoprotein Lpp
MKIRTFIAALCLVTLVGCSPARDSKTEIEELKARVDKLEVRELRARVDKLEARIDELEGKHKAARYTKDLRSLCRSNMQTIAHAEQAYLIKHPTGYEPNLQNLVGTNPDGTSRDLQAMPICPDGGTYSVDTGTNNQGPITIHCTIPDHDKTDDGNNTGYQPGRDAS